MKNAGRRVISEDILALAGENMNGCKYCVIIHHRKRCGKKLARGVAMCLAQHDMTRCEQKSNERGPGCEWHDDKVRGLHNHTFVAQHVAPMVG